MFTNWFYGNEISAYGKQNKRVDYRTFAKAFDCVLNNDIMQKTEGLVGYWEQKSGFIDNSAEIEEIEERIEKLQEEAEAMEDDEQTETAEYKTLKEKIEYWESEKEDLEYQETDCQEVYQWYIIDSNGAEICKEFNEIVYYNEELDLYLWGVTHWGTSWDYVLTDIPCEPTEEK